MPALVRVADEDEQYEQEEHARVDECRESAKEDLLRAINQMRRESDAEEEATDETT